MIRALLLCLALAGCAAAPAPPPPAGGALSQEPGFTAFCGTHPEHVLCH